MVYPLRERGIDRDECSRIIVAAGLPLPPKSACFFCPAMRQIEILQLARVDPDLHALALEMERLYRGGKHFKGDTFWTVKATHKVTGEKEVFECFADDAAGAREQFRAAYDDTAKPYKYKLRNYPAVPGLGRSFAWQDVETSVA